MQTEKELLYGILGEEGCEVGQAVSKCNRFGVHHINPVTKISNFEQVQQECIDFIATMERAGILDNLSFNEQRRRIDVKKQKIEKYLKISEECGRVILNSTLSAKLFKADNLDELVNDPRQGTILDFN